jgi:beta-glucosidase-like glycosyl hydrolase
LVPFIKGIENNVDSIMIGHLAVPALNEEKTLRQLCQNLLLKAFAKAIRYDGLVISDA